MFVDPGPAFEGPIQQIADALEAATDEFVRSANANAEAENAYLRAFRQAWLENDGVPVTIKSKECDQWFDVLEAKCAWNLADAHQKGCRQKCDELTNRLMAAMSWQKSVRAQT